MITLKDAIDDFLSRGLSNSKEDKAIVTLFCGSENGEIRKNTGKRVSSAPFLTQFGIPEKLELPLDSEELQELLPTAIKGSVEAHSGKKETAIRGYRKFVDFIRHKHHISIEVEFPPEFASGFERKMFMLKELQIENRGMKDLADKLWTNTRTLEEEFRSLRSGDSVGVPGQTLSVDGIKRKKGIISFESTAHPLILTPNLTQVVVLLEGLKMMAEDQSYIDYAKYLAADIWSQLTEYGQKRILFVSDILSLDKSWYEEISQIERGSLFRTERECSNEEGSKNIVYFAKSGERCNISYADDEGNEQILVDVEILKANTQDNKVKVRNNGKVYLIDKLNIRKCTLDPNRLY